MNIAATDRARGSIIGEKEVDLGMGAEDDLEMIGGMGAELETKGV